MNHCAESDRLQEYLDGELDSAAEARLSEHIATCPECAVELALYQRIFATLDATKHYLDGAKTYKVMLPKGIPAVNFWSLTLYDNQTRSMLDTPQRHPRAGSQSFPSPAAEADRDGATVVYFSPTQPKGVARGNWIQTDPKKGWFLILRLYSPLEPFFTKTWRPSEIELVK